MRCLVDTNALVFAANAASPHNAVVRAFLEARFSGGASWCVTWGNVYEFLRVTTHHRILAKPLTAAQAYQFIQNLIEHYSVSILAATDRHAELLGTTIAELSQPQGNLFHDIETAVLAREHGVPEIITTDTDFLQFRFLRVTNPLVDPA